MKLSLKYILPVFLGSSCLCNLQAKTCTQGDIEAGLRKGKFSYTESQCTNTGGIIKLNKSINISKSGTLLDGANLLLIQWTGGGSCSDKEGGPAAFNVNASNVLLKNFSIRDVPDGIHISSGNNNILEKVNFLKVCEDAVTNGNMSSSSAKKTIIRDSSFSNAQDKAIQVNGGSIKVIRSKFTNVLRPITACGVKANPGYHGPGKCPTASRIVFANNTVENSMSYGAQSTGQSGKPSFVVAINNKLKNVNEMFKAQGKSPLYAEGNVGSSCKVAFYTLEGGSMETCNNKDHCTTSRRGDSIKENCRTQDSLEKELGWVGALDDL